MSTVNIRVPDSFEKYNETIMSNLDHDIDQEVADHIKNKPLHSQYSGWNFCGTVWYQNEKWHCEVWTYNCYNETVSCDTLQEIMDNVCATYGDD